VPAAGALAAGVRAEPAGRSFGATPGMADPDPDLIAIAVLAVPHVAALSGGRFGEIATYLPGRRVDGIRIRPGQVEVHVVARYGPTMAEVGAAVRAAVVDAVGPVEVVVGIDDLAVPPAPHGSAAGLRSAADIHAPQGGTS
jgi:hypothetical protein